MHYGITLHNNCYFTPECLKDEAGEDYIGTKKVAKDGRACIAWTDYLSDDDFPDGSLAAANNYCRNPDHAGDSPDKVEGSGPWCFYNNFEDWDHCDISLCSK